MDKLGIILLRFREGDMWQKGNGHVRYINILTWLRGFQSKLLYLVLFFCIQVSWEL